MKLFDLVYYDYSCSCVITKSACSCDPYPARSLDAWLDELCLQHGSSLEGRRAYAKARLNTTRYLPVLVRSGLILIPSAKRTDSTLCYYRLDRIEHLEIHDKNRCTIVFKDGLREAANCASRLQRLIVKADSVLGR